MVGGAALALAYDERRATRVVDALFGPKALVVEAVLDDPETPEDPT